MDIKEQVLNELAQFCLEAESNNDLGDRAYTMDKFAERIVKLFAITAVSLDKQNGKDVCEHPIKFVVWCDEDKMYWCNKCERYV